MNENQPCIYYQRTRLAFVWTWILNTPFWAIYGMLPFILYRDLHGTLLQVAVMTTLKPMVSIFSMYWSMWIDKRKDRLRVNIVWAGILGHLPFLLFPFIDDPWYFVGAFGFYMLMARGGVPAWMEILKLNIPVGSREKVFAFASAFEYVGGGILPFVVGWLLDDYYQAWRWIFPIVSAVSIVAILLQLRIPIRMEEKIEAAEGIKWRGQILQPWKAAWKLLQDRRDFAKMQMGFMLGGAGIMLWQPALPMFFMGSLELSYTELAIALTLCKGIGFAATSSLWSKWIQKIDIYRFIGIVTIFAALFPMGLIFAQTNFMWLYIAYVFYGIMQAGSELSWHMSGPIFAKGEDSSIYSSVNVLTVGLRGCFIPPLGSLLSLWANPSAVLLIGGGLCLTSTCYMMMASRKLKAATEMVM